MRYLFLFLLFIFYSQAIVAQEGDIPLNHLEIPIPSQDYNFNDLKVDEQGRLLVAYKKGILQYDGNSWLRIETTSSPIKFLKIKSKNFLIAKDGIYEIVEDSFHQNKIEFRYKISIGSNIVDFIYFKGKYYLLANEEITVLNEEYSKTDVYTSNLGYKDIFVSGGKFYAFEGNYLLENIEGTWVDLNLYAPKNTDFLFSLKGNQNTYFAYDNGDFYKFDGQDFEPYSSTLNEYLKDNYPLSGKFLNQMLIISTLTGGVVLVNENTSEIISSIQNYNGLPTNEVSALTMDFQNGLWLAHPYGLSRASLDIPLSDFQFYPGLEGLPQVTLIRNDTFWVGTTEGLFFLKEVKDYETLQKKLIQKVKINERESEDNQDNSTNFFQDLFSSDNNSEEEKFIKNELRKYREIYRNDGLRFIVLKNKLDEKESQLRDSIQSAKRINNKSKNQSNSKARYRSVVKTIDISRLKSIDYEYRKVENINEHIASLINTDKGLIARGNTGIFLINKHESRKVSDLKMVKNILYQKEESLLWLANELGLFNIDLSSPESGTLKHSGKSFSDLLIDGNQIVAIGNNVLELFELSGNTLNLLNSVDIENKFSEELLLYKEGEKIKILRSDAILSFSTSASELTIDTIFNSPLKYFLKDQSNKIWLLNKEDEWSSINNVLSDQLRKWLHIIPSIKNINVVNDSIIYFTTNKRIIRWKSKIDIEYPYPKTFIDGVMVENKWIKADDYIELKHDQNNLKVILSTPEYLFKEDVEYQYFVRGLMDEWSNWSKNREIDFPYIPTGDYKLEIRVRTILNDEINDFEFNFEVLPPYWQTWWFYLIEIIFFSILILISIKLNTTNQSSYITKTFTFLTLILILEFFATILENNLEGYLDDSPVYTFIINVILALSITPIERGVSKVLVIVNSSRSKKLISKMRKNQKENTNE
jgi:ligand-binding sensor domain-containing protein